MRPSPDQSLSQYIWMVVKLLRSRANAPPYLFADVGLFVEDP